MTKQVISGDMKVWDVIQNYPETYEVFRQFGCPDMRKGMFAISAHIMKVRWAARAHHIELDKLLESLNEAVSPRDEDTSETRH